MSEIERVKPLSTNLVTQSDEFMDARYVDTLSKNEQKIVLAMISMIQPEDEDFKEYVMPVKDFADLIGLDMGNRSFYSSMKQTMKSLMKKLVEVPTPKGKKGWKLINWVATSEYVEGTGELHIKFMPDLKPYLLQLKSSYTSFQLSYVLSLTSGYSIRLYGLMKKWEKLGKWEVDVEELKLKLGAVKPTFARYNSFKTKILVKAIEELNEKTDLYIRFNEKKGKTNTRKVERIEFVIQSVYLEVKEEIKNQVEYDLSQLTDEDILRNVIVNVYYPKISSKLNHYSVPKIEYTLFVDMALKIWGEENNAKERIGEELEALLLSFDEELKSINILENVHLSLERAIDFVESSGFVLSFMSNSKKSPKLKEKEDSMTDEEKNEMRLKIREQQLEDDNVAKQKVGKAFIDCNEYDYIELREYMEEKYKKLTTV